MGYDSSKFELQNVLKSYINNGIQKTSHLMLNQKLSLSLHKYGNENITLSLFALKFYGCIKIRKQMQLVFFLIFVSALVYFPRFSY